MNIEPRPNSLYYGDCLDIMASFPSEYVDLICLDPPFNSNEKYHTIFKGSGLSIEPQLKAFDDMWLWDNDSAERVTRIKNAVANPASKVIAGFEQFIPQTRMLSYTSYMAERLFEMHHILKPTGSIYLHCDPTASHYLKLVMDAVFGVENFRNEIVWSYQGTGQPRNAFKRKHDTIFFYGKSEASFFSDVGSSEPISDFSKSKYTREDEKGKYKEIRHKDGSIHRQYIRSHQRMRDVWDIPTYKCYG